MSTHSFTAHAMATVSPWRPPYAPSWVDRLNRRLERLPIPVWLIYLAALILANLLYAALKWQQGSYPPGTFYPVHVVVISTGFYYLALIHYLDQAAHKALLQFQPALDPQSLPLEELDYRLTTMPARPALLWSGVGMLAGLAVSYLILRGVVLLDVVVFTPPHTLLLDTLIAAFANMIWGVFIYHTVHQLLMINRIYTTCAKIALFNLAPLYAFSRLTARTSFGWIALAYLWLSAFDYDTDLVIIAPILTITLLSIATFVWPLLGIHRLLEDEKARVKTEINKRFKASMDDLHQHVDHRRYADTVPLADTITGLKQALEIVEKIPTWPWQPETLRAVITAVLLPLALWLLTRTLERLLLL